PRRQARSAQGRPRLGTLATAPCQRGSGKRPARRTRAPRVAPRSSHVRALAAPGLRSFRVRVSTGGASWRSLGPCESQLSVWLVAWTGRPRKNARMCSGRTTVLGNRSPETRHSGPLCSHFPLDGDARPHLIRSSVNEVCSHPLVQSPEGGSHWCRNVACRLDRAG